MYQYFQPPLYWQQLEDFSARLLAEVYNAPNAQQFGNAGQAQHGVDVFGRSPRYGLIGMQCKRMSDKDKNGKPYPGGAISRKFLFAAAKESLSFPQRLNLWILVTTVRRDTKTQLNVEALNAQWRAQGIHRTAMVWSWDDCISYLNALPDLKNWYYSDVIQVNGSPDIDRMILETIAMAFQRPAFEVPLHAETSNDFLQAVQDTQLALRTGELVDRQSRHVIRKAIGGWRLIVDDGWRDALGEIDEDIKTLRTEIEQGLKTGTIARVNGFLEFTDRQKAGDLETLRSECKLKLNRVLLDARLLPIQI